MLKQSKFQKLEDVRAKNKCKCPNCGHTLLFNKPDKVICRWCKHYVFKNKKVEFEWRLRESINRKK